jgi:hypothetical protein
MARPTKNCCDYFPHDNGMRDHKKVKSLRAKFGITGYAVWSMLLEYLTGSDGNVFPYTEMEFELMSGDFGVSVTEIRAVVDYCIRLEMLFNKDGFVCSESLDERLAPVYAKRGKSKELSSKQRRVNGKYVGNNTEPCGVSVTEMPQSKVKESKVKGKEINTEDVIHFGQDNGYRVTIKKIYANDKVKIVYDLKEYFKHTMQLDALQKSGLNKFDEFMKANPANVFSDDNHLYNSFRSFCNKSGTNKPRIQTKTH